MKKVLVSVFIFLVACGNEQVYDVQPAYQYTGQYEYDYPEEKDADKIVDEIVLDENAHPYLSKNT